MLALDEEENARIEMERSPFATIVSDVAVRTFSLLPPSPLVQLIAIAAGRRAD